MTTNENDATTFKDCLKRASLSHVLKRPGKKEVQALARELADLCERRDDAGQHLDPVELVKYCSAFLEFFAPPIPAKKKHPWDVAARMVKGILASEPREWMHIIYVCEGAAYATNGKIALRCATDRTNGCYSPTGAECAPVDDFDVDRVVGMIGRAAAWDAYTGDCAELSSVAELRIEKATEYDAELTPLGIESSDARAFDMALVRLALKDPAKPFRAMHHPDRKDGRVKIQQGGVDCVVMPYSHGPFIELV